MVYIIYDIYIYMIWYILYYILYYNYYKSYMIHDMTAESNMSTHLVHQNMPLTWHNFQLDLEFCEKSLSAAASLRVLKVIQKFHHSNGRGGRGGQIWPSLELILANLGIWIGCLANKHGSVCSEPDTWKTSCWGKMQWKCGFQVESGWVANTHEAGAVRPKTSAILGSFTNPLLSQVYRFWVYNLPRLRFKPAHHVAALHLSCKLQSHGRMRRESGSTLLTLAAMDLDKHTIYDGKQVPNPPIMLSLCQAMAGAPTSSFRRSHQPPAIWIGRRFHNFSSRSGVKQSYKSAQLASRSTWDSSSPTGPYRVVFIPQKLPDGAAEQLGRSDTAQLCEWDGPSWHGLGKKKTCHHDHETMIYHGDVCRNVDQEQRNR